MTTTNSIRENPRASRTPPRQRNCEALHGKKPSIWSYGVFLRGALTSYRIQSGIPGAAARSHRKPANLLTAPGIVSPTLACARASGRSSPVPAAAKLRPGMARRIICALRNRLWLIADEAVRSMTLRNGR